MLIYFEQEPGKEYKLHCYMTTVYFPTLTTIYFPTL